MTDYLFEIISWFGLILCVGAFFIQKIILLRLCTVVGTIFMAIYYNHVGVEQGVIANMIVFAINFVYLVRERQEKNKPSTHEPEALSSAS